MNTSAKTTHVSVVTGATGMLGRATARELAARGSQVILVGRDGTRTARVLDELRLAGPHRAHDFVIGDLSDEASVRAIAQQISDKAEAIHALIHTAAIFTRQREENRAGQELMFATNVLARFLLTHVLTPQLKRGAPSRVLIATGPSPDRLDFEDLMARANFRSFMQFRATNAANLLFAFALARRLSGTGVTTNAYHPGVLQSNLMREMPALVRWITLPFGRRADKAAHALGDLALDDKYGQETGHFYHFEKLIEPPKNSADVHAQERLWETCEQLLGIS